jgi:hypothetical protein
VSWFTCTKHDDLGGAVPRRAIRVRRRALAVGESLASAEGAFAEWRRCADIHAKLHNAGGQISRLTEPGCDSATESGACLKNLGALCASSYIGEYARQPALHSAWLPYLRKG